MERLVMQRKPIRQSFTLTYKSLIEHLNSGECNAKQTSIAFTKLERLSIELNELDEKIINFILEINDEAKLEKEYLEKEEYKDKLDVARIEVKALESKQTYSHHSPSVCSSPTSVRRKLKLPKLELKQFGGEIKDWLSFWSQFKRIHEDREMEEEDKFQYLVQAMVKGTKARDIVESFPPTATNYSKVIDVLKNRFGRDELLIEHYVRELISLVIRNTTTAKSKINISNLYDTLESHLRALESIGMTRDKYEAMLFPLVESCIPEDTLRAWLRCPSVSFQSSLNDVEGQVYSNRLQQLLAFIKSEVESEERIQMARAGFKQHHRQDEVGLGQTMKCNFGNSTKDNVPTASSLYAGGNLRVGESPKQSAVRAVDLCIFCEKQHESRDCFRAQKMNYGQKKEILSKKRACFSCFKVGHRAKDCKCYIKCVLCSNKHQTIMCPSLSASTDKCEKSIVKSKVAENENNGDSSEQTIVKKLSANFSSQNWSQTVLLQTIMVNLSHNGQTRKVRALLDSGSQRSYILKQTAEELGLQATGTEDIIHALFGGVNSKKTAHKRYQITLSHLNGPFHCNVSVLDQPTICGFLPRLQYGPWYEEMKSKNIVPSDLGDERVQIELLIGADIWGSVMTGKIVRLSCGLVATESCFGWAVMGCLPVESHRKENSYGMTVTTLLTHSGNLSDLWSLDVLGIKDPYESKAREDFELAAKNHFESTVNINSDGRYEIMLPWLEGRERLQNNRNIAERRLQLTTEKLINAGKLIAYDQVFNEWEKANIIEEVNDEGVQEVGYFLPHRAVIKEEATTKIRPVFDASSKTKTSLSLNDCLEKGPNVIELIPTILLRFREKEIGVTSDIEKAFLQISVNEKDCEFLKFLWWENIEKKTIKVYKHRRVVFGLNCSPFMLGAVIDHHLNNCQPKFHATAEQLKRSFYVDNCVTSVSTVSELETFLDNASELMSIIKFNLRDWKSSLNDDIMANEPKSISVLGLMWDRSEDLLYCDLRNIETPNIITRRVMLSTVHKIFDPIGFLSPVTLIPKMLLQESWKSKLSWDVEVPQDVQDKFMKWKSDLAYLSNIKVPRYIGLGCNSNIEDSSLHIFCDASKISYATVIYLRIVTEGEVNVNLLMAKSRISPLKEMTIPKLELMACLIGARLAKTVKESLGPSTSNITEYYWTDSSTALCWIKKEEPWGVFIQNRVKEIRELTGNNWFHIQGEFNPADLPSRGCSARKLLESQWWKGPEWMRTPKDQWPKSEVIHNEVEIQPERKDPKTTSVYISNTNDDTSQWYLNYFSNYLSIVKMVGWLLRFVNNTRKDAKDRANGELSVSEITNAEYTILKQVQNECFGNKNLTNLKSLCIFQDKEGLLRVQTKITNRQDEMNNFKYPIVLPYNHNLVKLLIMQEHIQLSHAGLNILLTNLRERFWIIKSRRAVRSVINKCTVCRRHSAKSVQPVPVSLPSDRVKDVSIFEIIGVDLAGPLILKDGVKTWITVYTCAVYRAVHFELISSLSTNGFLLGLRRFIARRGRPKVVYSDNGSNFVGADNLFKSIDWSCVERKCTSVWRIQWKFNPPTAAWWGGWWERIVQMVKQILRRVLRKASVNYEEMVSILCDSESVINSRPLTYLSDEMEEIIPLTPAMFLIENSSSEVADINMIDDQNMTRKFRYQQRLRDDLRKRFRSEYLSTLVLKQNKHCNSQTLKEGDVVLIGSDGKKRLEWPLGRILQLFPGKDTIVRVVKLKTTHGEIIRPVQRLYPLEISQDNDKEEVISLKYGESEGKTPVEKQEDKMVKTRSGRFVKLPQRFLDYKI